MITFMDGPAADVTLTLQRAPLFLRVVVKQQQNLLGPVEDEVDALDQLTDTPRGDETVHVYVKVAGGRPVHIHHRDGRRASGWTAVALYKHLPHVDGERLRDTHAWRAWAQAQPEPEVRRIELEDLAHARAA